MCVTKLARRGHEVVATIFGVKKKGFDFESSGF